MFDSARFLDALSEFCSRLLLPYDSESVLGDLTAKLTEVLELAGAGVVLARDGRLEPAASSGPRVAALQQVQSLHQSGPGVEAFRTGVVVTVADLSEHGRSWPRYSSAAVRSGMPSVVGIPMRLHAEELGAVNLYGRDRRAWPERDVSAAVVMTKLTACCLVNASRYRQQEQLSHQLQQALASRVVIEQAKGMIAGAHGVDVDEAFQRIRRHARAHNATVAAVSDAIVRVGLRI